MDIISISDKSSRKSNALSTTGSKSPKPPENNRLEIPNGNDSSSLTKPLTLSSESSLRCPVSDGSPGLLQASSVYPPGPANCTPPTFFKVKSWFDKCPNMNPGVKTIQVTPLEQVLKMTLPNSLNTNLPPLVPPNFDDVNNDDVSEGDSDVRKSSILIRYDVDKSKQINYNSKFEQITLSSDSSRTIVNNSSSPSLRKSVSDKDLISDKKSISKKDLISRQNSISRKNSISRRDSISRRNSISKRDSLSGKESISKEESTANKESTINKQSSINKQSPNNKKSIITNKPTLGKVPKNISSPKNTSDSFLMQRRKEKLLKHLSIVSKQSNSLRSSSTGTTNSGFSISNIINSPNSFSHSIDTRNRKILENLCKVSKHSNSGSSIAELSKINFKANTLSPACFNANSSKNSNIISRTSNITSETSKIVSKTPNTCSILIYSNPNSTQLSKHSSSGKSRLLKNSSPKRRASEYQVSRRLLIKNNPQDRLVKERSLPPITNDSDCEVIEISESSRSPSLESLISDDEDSRGNTKEIKRFIDPLSPESRKKNEFCSYLQLMNLSDTSNKEFMVSRHRRSTRVQNQVLSTVRREFQKQMAEGLSKEELFNTKFDLTSLTTKLNEEDKEKLLQLNKLERKPSVVIEKLPCGLVNSTNLAVNTINLEDTVDVENAIDVIKMTSTNNTSVSNAPNGAITNISMNSNYVMNSNNIADANRTTTTNQNNMSNSNIKANINNEMVNFSMVKINTNMTNKHIQKNLLNITKNETKVSQSRRSSTISCISIKSDNESSIASKKENNNKNIIEDIKPSEKSFSQLNMSSELLTNYSEVSDLEEVSSDSEFGTSSNVGLNLNSVFNSKINFNSNPTTNFATYSNLGVFKESSDFDETILEYFDEENMEVLNTKSKGYLNESKNAFKNKNEMDKNRSRKNSESLSESNVVKSKKNGTAGNSDKENVANKVQKLTNKIQNLRNERVGKMPNEQVRKLIKNQRNESTRLTDMKKSVKTDGKTAIKRRKDNNENASFSSVKKIKLRENGLAGYSANAMNMKKDGTNVKKDGINVKKNLTNVKTMSLLQRRRWKINNSKSPNGSIYSTRRAAKTYLRSRESLSTKYKNLNYTKMFTVDNNKSKSMKAQRLQNLRKNRKSSEKDKNVKDKVETIKFNREQLEANKKTDCTSKLNLLKNKPVEVRILCSTKTSSDHQEIKGDEGLKVDNNQRLVNEVLEPKDSFSPLIEKLQKNNENLRKLAPEHFRALLESKMLLNEDLLQISPFKGNQNKPQMKLQKVDLNADNSKSSNDGKCHYTKLESSDESIVKLDSNMVKVDPLRKKDSIIKRDSTEKKDITVNKDTRIKQGTVVKEDCIVKVELKQVSPNLQVSSKIKIQNSPKIQHSPKILNSPKIQNSPKPQSSPKTQIFKMNTSPKLQTSSKIEISPKTEISSNIESSTKNTIPTTVSTNGADNLNKNNSSNTRDVNISINVDKKVVSIDKLKLEEIIGTRVLSYENRGLPPLENTTSSLNDQNRIKDETTDNSSKTVEVEESLCKNDVEIKVEEQSDIKKVYAKTDENKAVETNIMICASSTNSVEEREISSDSPSLKTNKCEEKSNAGFAQSKDSHLPDQQIVHTTELPSTKCDFIRVTPNVETKSLRRSLVQTKRKRIIDIFGGECSSQNWEPFSPSPHQKTLKDRKQSFSINISERNGDVLYVSYLNYDLVIAQELVVSFWKQTGLGNVLGATNMFIPKGSMPRLVLDAECNQKASQERMLSLDSSAMLSSESSVAYIELWTKEHKSFNRERPVADVFAAIYFWSNTGPQKLGKKVLQLENIKGFAEDVQYIVLQNSRSIVVSWNIVEDDEKKTIIHMYNLASDYQSIVNIKELATVNHYVSSLHNIEDCDSIIFGTGEHKFTFWNLEYGYIVETIDVVDARPEWRTLVAKCDTGFVFMVQSTDDKVLRLLAINGINETGKKLQVYKASERHKNLKGVCMDPGVITAFYETGVSCWRAGTGECILDEILPETVFVPSSKHVLVMVDDEIHLRCATTYLLTLYDS